LGFRVPCLIISPFSRGGFVCGDVFDHTSTLRFIEKRFGAEVPNLTQWRRDTCGDLTSAFGFGEPPNASVPVLPATAGPLADVLRRLKSPILPKPAAPRRQSMPAQEAATITRQRRA
jgi:phospholipase C